MDKPETARILPVGLLKMPPLRLILPLDARVPQIKPAPMRRKAAA